MASFAYRGVSVAGRSVSGVVEAESPKSARARLREQGILAPPVRETEAAQVRSFRSTLTGRRVSARELARTVRRLATLLTAGIPLVDAVTSLLNRELVSSMAAALETIRSDLTAGMSLERAVAKHPAVFPGIYRGMIAAGEASGSLDAVLVRIADHAEANARLQAQLRAAMTYPTIMMLVGGGIVTFLLAYVVPQVTRVFMDSGRALPLPTRVLMALGGFIASYGPYLLVAAVAAVLALRFYTRTERGRRRAERLLFALPWAGTVVRNIAMARFAHTFEAMISGGMPLVEALDVSRTVAGSSLLADRLVDAREAVSQGATLAGTLGRDRLFNPMLVDMIAVGEKSGALEAMLARAAEALDEEVAGNVETMAGLLEPIMILMMAGVVLFVILAVLLPVFEMNQLVR